MHKYCLLLAAAAATLLTGCGPAMTELNGLAGEGRIDDKAPVQVHLTAEVAAPPARVWTLLIDAPRWSRWEPGITDVSVAQPLADATAFTWKAGGTAIRSRVTFFRPDQRIVWTGRIYTAKAIHSWTLTPLANGGTRVTTDESMDGPLITMLVPQKKLADADGEWLQALKTAAER